MIELIAISIPTLIYSIMLYMLIDFFVVTGLLGVKSANIRILMFLSLFALCFAGVKKAYIKCNSNRETNNRHEISEKYDFLANEHVMQTKSSEYLKERKQ